MATIADLNVRVSATVDPLIRGMTQATRATDQMARKLTAADTPIRQLQASTRSLANAFLPVSIGSGLVVFGLRKIFQAADEFDASLRTLASTAAITGQNLGFLQKTSEDARRAFGLSTVAANNLTIEVVKLTSKAGQIDQTRAALAAFLNLGAGRGMGAQQTLEAVRQAILGIDEGTDKLFNANPIVLYQQYAQSIGTTVAKLNDAQKAQAILNAALVGGGKVATAYADFLKSPQGQAEQLRIKTEQAAAGVGHALNGLRSIAVQVLSVTFVPLLKGVAEYVPKAALVIARAFTYIPEYLARAAAAAMSSLADFGSAVDRFREKVTLGLVPVNTDAPARLRQTADRFTKDADEFRARIERNFQRTMKEITDTVNLTVPITGDTSALDTLLTSLLDHPTGGTTQTALEQQAAAVNQLATAYEGLSARQQDTTGVLSQALSLNDQIEAALRRQTDAASATANELRNQQDTLRQAVPLLQKMADLRAQMATTPLVTTPPNLTPVPVATPPVVAPVAQEGLLSKLLGGTVGQLAAQFGPLALAAAALRPVFEGLRDVLGPVLSRLAEPLQVVGQVIGDTLVPILDALEDPLKVVANLITTLMIPVQALTEILTTLLQPALKLLSGVVKGVTFVLSYLYEAIGFGVRTIGQLIDKLPFISGGPIIRAGQEMIDGARSARRGLEDLRETAEKLNEALINVVQGFKVERFRFAATNASLVYAPPPPAPPGSTPGTPGGGRIGNVTFNVGGGAPEARDRKQTYREWYEQMDQQSRGNPEAREVFLIFPEPALA